MAGIEASKGNLDDAAADVDKGAKGVSAADRGKLLDAYNAMGDDYQNAGKMDKAVPYFSKAIAEGFDTQTEYARISIAMCFAQSNKLAQAKPYLEALLKMPHPTPEYAAQAKQLLAAINAQK